RSRPHRVVLNWSFPLARSLHPAVRAAPRREESAAPPLVDRGGQELGSRVSAQRGKMNTRTRFFRATAHKTGNECSTSRHSGLITGFPRAGATEHTSRKSLFSAGLRRNLA